MDTSATQQATPSATSSAHSDSHPDSQLDLDHRIDSHTDSHIESYGDDAAIDAARDTTRDTALDDKVGSDCPVVNDQAANVTEHNQPLTSQDSWQEKLSAIETLPVQPITRELSCLLQQEWQLAHQLQCLMQEEFKAVENQQLETLEKLTTHKASLLNQLQQSAEQRLQWMQQHDLPITSHCVTTAPLANCQQSKAWWQLLATTYEDNRQLSNRLADIVLTLKRRTQRKLDLLSGKPSDQVLYNQTGVTQGKQMGRGGIKV